MITFSVGNPKLLFDHFQTLVYPVFEGELDVFINEFLSDPFMATIIQHFLDDRVVTGKKGELTYIPLTNQKDSRHIVLFGLGRKSDNKSIDYLRQSAGKLPRFLRKYNLKESAFMFSKGLVSAWHSQAILSVMVEGIILGDYHFQLFKKSKTEKSDLHIKFLVDLDAKYVKTVVKHAETIAENINKARDLANMPPNHLTPKQFKKQIEKDVKEIEGISIEVFDNKAMEKMGMGAFLGVAQGSCEAPYLIKLSLNEDAKEEPIVLVGKGVTFDSGGLSLKSSKGMEEMKADMTGAAVAYASLLSLAKQYTKQSVVALLALVENMPAAGAQRPGDVVKTMDGTHVEVLNTDAEGRLILADTLCYAKTLKPKVIVDVATLTGAAVVALGTLASAAFTNHSEFLKKLLACSEEWGENIWQLPLYEGYRDMLKSDVADIKNVGGPYGGACTAAMFLKEFVGDTPWIHLDISPKMSSEKTKGADIKGMQAPCIRSIVEWVHSLS